jgi:hypothetical protein
MKRTEQEIEARRELDKSKNRLFTRRITKLIRLSEKNHRQIRMRAIEAHKTMSKQLDQVISDYYKGRIVIE